MDIPVRKLRLDDDVMTAINSLPGRSVNDKLRGLLIDGKASTASVGESPALAELLDLVRALPDIEDLRFTVETTIRQIAEERKAERQQPGFDPHTIPGVQRGANGLQPRRESGTERVEREERERLARVQALDPVDDPSIDRSGEYVSG